MPAIAAMCLALVATMAQPAAVAELTTAVDQYRHAIVKGDRETLARLLHDDFAITSGDGQTRDKAGELADLWPRDSRCTSSGWMSRATGPPARRATGILRWRMTFNGRESTVERRTTMTWARAGDRWQMIAQHVSRVK